MTRVTRQRLVGGLLILGALGAFLAFRRAAGSPLTSEDVRWLDLAVHGRPSGEPAESFGHLALLRLFVGAAEAPFAAARSLAALLLTVACVALVLGARSLAEGCRVIVLAATGGLLFLGQTHFFARTGTLPPESTAMAWIGLGVAVTLAHPTVGAWGKRRRIDALLLGGLTTLAWRTDPSGAILLWCSFVLFREDGKWRIRGSRDRLVVWVVGAVAALVLLAAASALLVERPPEAGPALATVTSGGWVEALWPARAGGSGSGGLRVLGLLVLGAAVAAPLTGRDLDERLLRATPLVFVAALLVLQLFGYEVEPVDLWPVLPTACLFAATLFLIPARQNAGASRKYVAAWLLPLAALGLVVLVLEPYLAGRLAAERLVPWLGPIAAADFLRRTLGPLLAIGLLIAAAFGLRWPRLRRPLLLAATVLAVGPGSIETLRLLATAGPADAANDTLRPWTHFESELDATRPVTIAVSPALLPAGPLADAETTERIARLALGRPFLEVGSRPRDLRQADCALLTVAEADERTRRQPRLAARLLRDLEEDVALLCPRRKEPGIRRKPTRDRREKLRAKPNAKSAEASQPR